MGSVGWESHHLTLSIQFVPLVSVVYTLAIQTQITKNDGMLVFSLHQVVLTVLTQESLLVEKLKVELKQI